MPGNRARPEEKKAGKVRKIGKRCTGGRILPGFVGKNGAKLLIYNGYYGFRGDRGGAKKFRERGDKLALGGFPSRR